MQDAEPFTLIGANVGGVASTLRLSGSRIAALGAAPRRGERTIDLDGDRVLPGLINAHDHLQLNGLPRTTTAGPWRNAREWIAHVNALMRSDREFTAGASLPRERRLRLGGLKNLLSGVTTVAHHDPLYAALEAPDFPVRVVTRFGWSHSIDVDGEDAVRRSHAQTPRDRPWIIHAAEGVDAAARSEFDTLAALGCLTSNAVLVHGVGLDDAQLARLEAAGAALVWCPGSNLALFGTTARVEGLLRRNRVALGTDSRLTGTRDLLQELRLAASIVPMDEPRLEALVTSDSAHLLRLVDRGAVRAGFLADLLVLPAGLSLSEATRADLRLVMIDGTVRLADPDLALRFAPASAWTKVMLDGRPKCLASAIAAAVRGTGVDEPGLEFADASWRAA